MDRMTSRERVQAIADELITTRVYLGDQEAAWEWLSSYGVLEEAVQYVESGREETARHLVATRIHQLRAEIDMGSDGLSISD